MKYSDINQVFPSTSSLTIGSYFSKEDSDYLLSNVLLSNFPFGKSDKDSIQIDVFTFDGTEITSSYFVPTGEILSHTKSYYDVFNKYSEYSYSSYRSDFPIIGRETKSVFFDLSAQLNKMEIQTGNYKVGIQLIREVVGSHTDGKQSLLIDSISPSRTEITLIPFTNRDDSSRVNDEFYAFLQDRILLRDVVDGIVDGISNPEIYKIYYTSAANSPDGADAFIFNYGFGGEVGRNGAFSVPSNIQAVNFITDLYYGVKKDYRQSNGQFSQNGILGIFDQFSNWIYSNYNSASTFDELKTQYYSFVRYIIDQELNRITNTKPNEYDKIVDFLSDIYYNSIFYPVISRVEETYKNYISGYFKNFVKVNDLLSISILNKKVIPSTSVGMHDKLAIKLAKPLSSEIVRGQKVHITNTFASPPIFQNVYFFYKEPIVLNKLRGPNFIGSFENEGNSTEAVSLDQLIGETGSLYDELISKLDAKSKFITIKTDYRKFENFATFSSVELRLGVYNSKVELITELERNISDLNANLVLKPNDEYYAALKTKVEDELNTLKSSFDGYETFLNENPAWHYKHGEEIGGFTSASLYDLGNGSNLINGIPEFISTDDLNYDYIKFVGMIGHYFDNLSIYIKQFTEKNNISSAPNVGVSMDLVYDTLVSLGWDPEISKENLPLLLGSFSKQDFSEDSPLYSKVGNLSESDRNKLIWKRILNTLPFIYKTKGTKASVNAIISCFGIPKNLIKIKEYGSVDSQDENGECGLYLFEETKYEPYFSGSGEYFELPWTGSANSLELNVRFDKDKTSEEGHVFRLVSCHDNWVVGVYRERGLEWGKVFFSLDDGSGSAVTMMTQKVPIFDGRSYSVMLRKNDVGRPIDYPVQYELLVKRSTDDRITFAESSSLIVSESFNRSFVSGSSLFVGNYNQNTSSLGVDPEAFFGNLDEIKLWEIPIDNQSMESHVLYKGGYNYSSPETMVDKLLVRISFNQPVNLWDTTTSGSVSIENTAFRSDFPTIYAKNFTPVVEPNLETPECGLLTSTPMFPYQFGLKNINQAVKVSSYGSQTIRNNKIAHVNQSLLSSLSSTGRSSVAASWDSPSDSNKIGVFFSPIDSQNEEILKFFGNFNFGDLIGDPALVYESSYRQFEKFRQIYYDQGFGIVDYQSFMNVVRAYFDKSMFKYIGSVVPARSKYVSGILVEPSILERPKLKQKPTTVQDVGQLDGTINFGETIRSTKVQQQSANVGLRSSGTSILNDVNHMFYSDLPDKYGFGVYSSDGIFVDGNEFYRVDIIKTKKSYQRRSPTLPLSQIDYYEDQTNLGGTLQTISRSYYELNLIKLPTVSEFNFTASYYPTFFPTTTREWYFSGSISIPLTVVGTGYINTTVSSSHYINGITSGSMWGETQFSNGYRKGILTTPMKISASFYPIGTPVLLSGYYDDTGGNYTFEGSIIMESPPTLTLLSTGSVYRSTLYASTPTSSIFYELKNNTRQDSETGLFLNTNEIFYRKEKSLLVVPENREMLTGYFSTHYKYKKQTFSQKEINAIENIYVIGKKSSPIYQKWRRGSQSKKTTIDNLTGNLNGSDPVEIKSV
jgi:hypothetical protein